MAGSITHLMFLIPLSDLIHGITSGNKTNRPKELLGGTVVRTWYFALGTRPLLRAWVQSLVGD